jgi:hypothetical protein
MNAEEFHRELMDYIGQRELAFFWREVPKTEVWHDLSTNFLCSSVGVKVGRDGCETVWDCVNDLCDAVAGYYREEMGLDIHEAPTGEGRP